MIPYLLNDILYFMSSCFGCKHSYYNGCISVSIDNSMIDFDRLNFDPGNMNKNFVLSLQLKRASRN